jgi:hypothetical protein
MTELTADAPASRWWNWQPTKKTRAVAVAAAAMVAIGCALAMGLPSLRGQWLLRHALDAGRFLGVVCGAQWACGSNRPKRLVLTMGGALLALYALEYVVQPLS